MAIFPTKFRVKRENKNKQTNGINQQNDWNIFMRYIKGLFQVTYLTHEKSLISETIKMGNGETNSNTNNCHYHCFFTKLCLNIQIYYFNEKFISSFIQKKKKINKKWVTFYMHIHLIFEQMSKVKRNKYFSSLLEQIFMEIPRGPSNV